jgi:hypothetical protein
MSIFKSPPFFSISAAKSAVLSGMRASGGEVRSVAVLADGRAGAHGRSFNHFCRGSPERSRRPGVAVLFRVHESALRGSAPMARDQFAQPIAGGETEREDGD